MKTKYEYNKKYVTKYLLEKVDEFKLRAPKGTKSRVQRAAQAADQSVNGYIIQAIEERMQREAETTESR